MVPESGGPDCGESKLRATTLLVADVAGLSHYHVGDEAILTARLAWFRREVPELNPVVLSEDPDFTARVHGVQVLAEPRVPRWLDSFWFNPWKRRRFQARVLEALCRGMSPALGRALAEVKRSSVLSICGGGSLTSSYGALLRLRSLLAGYALACDVPVVVTGQQIGPLLSGEDEAILRGWLPRAGMVGVRDGDTSVKLGLRAGVPPERLAVTGDDALDLVSMPPPVLPMPCRGARPCVGLSLHLPGSRAERTERLAEMVQCLAPWLRSLDADILWLPHLRSSVPYRCDIQLARDFTVAAGLCGRMVVADSPDYLDTHIKHLTGLCDFVVSTRYHGLVFALTSGVPGVGVSQDDYTDAKIKGLYAYFGLDWPVPSMRDPGMPSILAKAWNNRGLMAAQATVAWGEKSREYRALRETLAQTYRVMGQPVQASIVRSSRVREWAGQRWM